MLLCAVLPLSRRKVKGGVLLSIYFIGYGIGRFSIEGLRTDSLNIMPGIRVSQMLSLLLIAVGIAMMVHICKGVLKTQSYEGKYLLKKE